jgi:low temperature requirement protein LtrA
VIFEVFFAILAAAVPGIVAALCLWWLYFDVVSRAAEPVFRDAQGQARVRMALEAYTYGHFPIVAGIETPSHQDSASVPC